MDPKGAEEQDTRIDRLLKLRERLKSIPLSAFVVGDLPALSKAMGCYHNAAGQIGPYDEDFRLLEERITQFCAHQGQEEPLARQ